MPTYFKVTLAWFCSTPARSAPGRNHTRKLLYSSGCIRSACISDFPPFHSPCAGSCAQHCPFPGSSPSHPSTCQPLSSQQHVPCGPLCPSSRHVTFTQPPRTYATPTWSVLSVPDLLNYHQLAHTHTHVHANTHTYTHTHTHTHTQAHAHTHAQTELRHTHARPHAHTYTHTYIQMHAHTCTNIITPHTRTPTCTHIHAHIHAHLRTHTYKCTPTHITLTQGPIHTRTHTYTHSRIHLQAHPRHH